MSAIIQFYKIIQGLASAPLPGFYRVKASVIWGREHWEGEGTQRWRWLDDTSGFVSFVTIFRTIQFSKHCATECVRLTEAKIFFEIIQEVNRLFHACQHRRNKFNPNNSGNILILYVNTVKDVNDLTDFYSAF